MLPFFGRIDQVVRCLALLLKQAQPQTVFLLVDDGSNPAAQHDIQLAVLLQEKNVFLIRHRENLGVAAARNSGLHWCRARGIDLVIMIDSDCEPGENFTSEHLRLHAEHPEAACIGGQIIGEGKSFWAKLDGLTSWIHATPWEVSQQEFRCVEHPYHLATTNFSLKLSQMPQREMIFDERLISGEDCLLVRELRAMRKPVCYSSTPVIRHRDREPMADVFRHHYEWGHHQYFIQLGGNISARCFNPLYRLVFCAMFLPLLPLFALAGSILNTKPLLRHHARVLLFYPWIYALWFGKGIAVMEAAICPHACLRDARKHIHYDLVQPG
jgi:GT2 family glycosyltransferase